MTASSGGTAALSGVQLRAGSPLGAHAHEHVWALRETEYDDSGTTINRFECHCGEVSYT